MTRIFVFVESHWLCFPLHFLKYLLVSVSWFILYSACPVGLYHLRNIGYFFRKCQHFHKLNGSSMVLKGFFYLWFIFTKRRYIEHFVNFSFEDIFKTESRFLKSSVLMTGKYVGWIPRIIIYEINIYHLLRQLCYFILHILK